MYTNYLFLYVVYASIYCLKKQMNKNMVKVKMVCICYPKSVTNGGPSNANIQLGIKGERK